MEPTPHDEFDDLIGTIADAVSVVAIVLGLFALAALAAWWSV